MTSTTASTSNFVGSAIAEPLRAALGYGQVLLGDIPAEQFTHMPHPAMNHPAFCVGHLLLYPARIASLVGRENVLQPNPLDERLSELFEAGQECVANDDRCPPKDELVELYVKRHTQIGDLLLTVADDVFQQENPMEGRFKQMLPTIGAAVNFLANSHHMLHLGQISAWRRAVGLGPAM